MTNERATLSETDEGKTVVDADGTTVGMVTRVTDEAIYVRPDPSLMDRIRATLEWGDDDEDDYRIETAEVARVTGSEIELRRSEGES